MNISESLFKKKPDDAYVFPSAFYQEIATIHQEVTHRQNAITRSTFYTWLDAVEIERQPTGLRAPYRGFEFNQVLIFVEALIKTGSKNDAAEIVRVKIESGELANQA